MTNGRSSLLCWLLLSTSLAVVIPQTSPDPLPTCTIERGTDHYLGDYAQLQEPNFDECVAACQADPNCVTAQYTVDNGSCYLKNELNPATADARVDSAICRPPASVASTSTSITTTTTSVSPAMTMTTTSTSATTLPSMKGTCSIVYDTDYFGGDYGNMYTPTFDACVQACEDDSRCVTVQYDNPTNICYLKSVLTQPSANTRVDTAICRPPSTSTTSAPTTATTSSTPTPSCTIITGTDYYGGDYDAFYATSFQECIMACQSDAQCIDTQFSYTYQRCYLKNILTTPNSNPQVDTAICRGPDVTTTSTTTTTSTATTTSQMPSGTACFSLTGQGGFALNAIITVDLDQPCTDNSPTGLGTGVQIVNIQGVLNGAAISFGSSNYNTPDSCLYNTNGKGKFLSLHGTDFAVGSRQYNIFFSAGFGIYYENNSSGGAGSISLVLGPQMMCPSGLPPTTTTTLATTPASTITTITSTTSTTSMTFTTLSTTTTTPMTTSTALTASTTTTSALPTSAVCFTLTAPAPFALNAVLTVDLDTSCGSNGYKIINTQGTLTTRSYNNAAISFDASGNYRSPDYCLFPSSQGYQKLDSHGTNFFAAGVQFNLFYDTLQDSFYEFDNTVGGYAISISPTLGSQMACLT